mgnify:CR=1 FL=1
MKKIELWIGDLLQKTAHLTREELGVYLTLLLSQYATEGALPLDAEALHRVANAHKSSERAACDRIMRDAALNWEQHAEGWVQKRAAEEIDKRRAYVASQAERSALGVAARARAQPDEHGEISARPKGNGAGDPAIEHIPLRDGSSWPVTQAYIDELAPLYPLVDVPATIRTMHAWCVGNPDRRKTVKGVRKFISGWLAREQSKYEAEDAEKNQ